MSLSEHNDYLRSALSTKVFFDNYMVRFTLNGFGPPQVYPMPFGDVDDAAVETTARVLDSFDVVGTAERLNETIFWVSWLFRLPLDAVPEHVNARNQTDMEYDNEPLPSDVEDLIIERTKYDMKLYQRYAPRKSPLLRPPSP